MLKTYHGSCHCGAVRFECELDLADGTRRCNCTYCWKVRMWKVFAIGDTFRIIEGADRLTDYRGPNSNWAEGAIHHYFCRDCGVHGFSKGYLEFEPFNGWFHAVNIAALDDITPEELDQVPLQYEDGINNDYERPPRFHAYL